MDINKILQKVDELYAAGQGAAAEELMCKGIEEAVAKQDNESLLQLLNELLGYYREVSQVEKSFAIAEQLIGLTHKMGLENTIPYATTLLNIANAYRAGGKLEESLGCYERVREIYEKTLAPDNMLVASLENNLSLLYQEMGEFREAKKSLLRALEIVLAKDAEFEIAVTYANLANTCMQLGDRQESYTYGVKAINAFEKTGVADAHYGAALSAMGMYYFDGKEYAEAKEYFSKAMDIMEQNLGRNEYYYRLKENVEECTQALMQEDGMNCGSNGQGEDTICDVSPMKGLDLCRDYYEDCVRPMIEEHFPGYAGKIAVGLAGEGSDCFGFDDELSRDHDWGPDICMWVSEGTYGQIGEALQKAYEQLPGEYKGYRRTMSPQGVGRRGVITIEGFFKRLLGIHVDMEKSSEISTEAIIEAAIKEIDWTMVTDAALAAAVNGEVFKDDEGIVTVMRERLLAGYPEEILFKKLAESVAGFSQAGQYNLNRCLKRVDNLTAGIMLSDCIREAMKLKHYMDGKYPPHDKWLKESTKRLTGGIRLVEALEKLSEEGMTEQLAAQIENIASEFARELYAKNYISDIDSYLDAHTEELLVKASLSSYTDEQLTDKIARLEFVAFDKVQNVGGRAGCQNDWPTFYVMRKSQYLTWNRVMLMQYYYDFQREYNRGHNLIEEKYGRMMESTAPAEYKQIKEHFPYISPGKQAIIEQIVALQVTWMEEFAKEYPQLAENARSVRTAEDNLYNTSYETYLRGEISTYSDKMLELYGRYVVEYATENKNLAYEIMGNSTRMYGYDSLEAAEASN